MKLPAELYDSTPSLRMAFTDGRLQMCEEIRDLIHQFMAQSKINPFKDNSDFEEGQMFALTAIIQQCMAIEEQQNKEDNTSIEYDA